MKTVFIVNPMAGQGGKLDKLTEDIKLVAERVKSDVDIYFTKAVGDATEYVRSYCEKHGAARFIACGGDGTLCEVVNGAIACSEAEVGIIPIGTGNDFSRNFPGCGDFNDIEAQICGETSKCDVIRYKSIKEREEKVGYCINMFNIGFDCNVADMTAKMKTKPFVSGSMAYFLSILAMLIKKKGANLKVEVDGKEIHKGPLLLTSLANGSFCGGGIKSNPLASVKDGLINLNLIYNISRMNFLSKLPFYMKGTHIKLKNIEKVIFNTVGKKIVLTPLSGKMKICVDGEVQDAGVTEFEIVHNALNFVMPHRNSIKINEKEAVTL